MAILASRPCAQGKKVDDALFTRVLGSVGLGVALVAGLRGREGGKPAERLGPRC